ncbi:hypothetical protein U8C37_03200 [Sinorhizobium medicae]|uniref:hypothetical protein n=1 Tax=Sinorhizobium medicae TaxID=110321 RepID=UPI002AF6B62F|nr:hypothetical protein [Sinorhizobium medicae]WQO86411.1 hypothetical protein U8C37_03200 [Sinorhizobium medicae]
MAAEYRDEVAELREKRKERGEKAQSVQEQLSEMDWAKMSEQSAVDMQTAIDDYASSLGDAFYDYMKGPGKPQNVIDAGVTIITETLPAYSDMLDAAMAPIDFQDKMDELNAELGRYNREMEDFDKKIKGLEDEIKLSENVADFYEQEVETTRTKTKEVVFKLVESTKVVKEIAQQKHDTIPVGWVECTCPAAHAGLGRLIKSKRFHPPGQTCPGT